MQIDEVTLETADGPMAVYQAVPDGGARRAVIVIQEAFGVNDHIQDVTRRFADAGYHAVAPAIFLLFWSGGYAAGKVGLGYTGPFTLLAVRYGLVLLILVPLVLIMRPPLPRTSDPRGSHPLAGDPSAGIFALHDRT